MVAAAIVVAREGRPRTPGGIDGPPGAACPVALLPVLNRPVIMHVLASLAELGIERSVVLADRSIAPALRAAVGEAPAGEMPVGFMERSPDTPLLAAIAASRERIGDGPFVLRFADCLSIRKVGPQLEPGRELGEHDAVALMSRFDAPPGTGQTVGEDAAWALMRPGGTRSVNGEFHVGTFLLGAGFPRSLAAGEERRALPVMAAALEQMEREGGRVQRRFVTGWWRYRGHPQPILQANGFMLSELTERACEATVIDSDLEGTVDCDPSARIESSVIRGPVLIGPDVEIKDAFIGPFSTLGRGVRIEAAELENSVILAGSSISNIGVRLDSSVVGPRARVLRDFRMPRGARLSVGPDAQVILQ